MNVIMYLLFVYNRHHGVCYIKNLNDVEIPMTATNVYSRASSQGTTRLGYLSFLTGITLEEQDECAREIAKEVFQKKEGGFDRYYKVVKITQEGNMYDITKEPVELSTIELTGE